MHYPNGHRVIRVRPEQPHTVNTGPLYQKRIQRREFITLGRGSWDKGRGGSYALPLAPDSIGVWRHVRDCPMHIPKACVACGFVQQADDHKLGIANTRGRDLVGRSERLETAAHSRAILENRGSDANLADQVRQRHIRGARGLLWCGVNGVRTDRDQAEKYTEQQMRASRSHAQIISSAARNASRIEKLQSIISRNSPRLTGV